MLGMHLDIRAFSLAHFGYFCLWARSRHARPEKLYQPMLSLSTSLKKYKGLIESALLLGKNV